MSRISFLVLQDYAGIVEKSELAEKVKQAASQGPEGQASTVPVGYAYDPSSGEHKHVSFSLLSAYCLLSVSPVRCWLGIQPLPTSRQPVYRRLDLRLDYVKTCNMHGVPECRMFSTPSAAC